MNSINNTIHGLASSLFLNVGLTSIAEKLDPVQSQSAGAVNAMVAAESCSPCVYPCMFTPDSGQ